MIGEDSSERPEPTIEDYRESEAFVVDEDGVPHLRMASLSKGGGDEEL